MVLKLPGGVAEPASERGVETPRNSDVSKSLTLSYTNQCIKLLSFSLLNRNKEIFVPHSGITKLKPINPWELIIPIETILISTSSPTKFNGV